MTVELTNSDLEFILESLKYTRMAFEDYQQYPSYDYKLKRINDANEVILKVEKLKKTS
ncbi:hypothetical protein [Lacinutrix chionoecetis]